MVCVKLLLVLFLVVALACETCHAHHKPRHAKKRCRGGTIAAIKEGLKGSCRFLFKGLKKHCKLPKKLFNDLVNIQNPNDFDSSLDFILKLGVGSGSAVEIFIPGLGDLTSRLIAVALRLLTCNLKLFGNRKSFCHNDDFKEFYDVSVRDIDNVNTLLKRFKCNNARDDFNSLINKHSDGQGIDKYSGSKRTVINIFLDILKIVEKKDNCSKSDLTTLFGKVISLVGTVGNGYSKNLGTGFTDQALKSVNKYLIKTGCPSLDNRKSDINVVIQTANDDDDDSPWGDLSDDGSGDDDVDALFDELDSDNKSNKAKTNGDGEANNSVVDDSYTDVTTYTPLGGYLQVFFKPILKGKGRCRVSHDTLNELMTIRPPQNFIDVANFIANLSIVVASVIDTLIRGMGSLMGRIFLFVPRGDLCIRKTGYDGFCTRDFVQAYNIDGDADNIDDLISLYKIKGARDQVVTLIKKHTKGKGVKAVIKGAQKNVLASCVKIAELVDNFTDDAFSKLYIELTKIMGIVANSFDKQHILGNNITNSMSAMCDKYVQQKGYQAIDDHQADIKNIISCAKTDTTFMTTITTTTVITITTEETTEESVQMQQDVSAT